jgi:hypothetical protein
MKTLSTLFLAVVLSAGVCAQAPSPPSTNDVQYQQALDLLFPLDALKQPALYFVTILRYAPSFEPESQIVPIGREGYAEVIEYRSSDGNLYYKLDDLLRKGDVTASDFAKQVRVSRRSVRIPFALAQTWRKNLLDGVATASRPEPMRYVTPPKKVNVVTDGTKYEIWDSGTNGDLHFGLDGGQTHKRAYPKRASFITWMDAVRRGVAERR